MNGWLLFKKVTSCLPPPPPLLSEVAPSGRMEPLWHSRKIINFELASLWLKKRVLTARTLWSAYSTGFSTSPPRSLGGGGVPLQKIVISHPWVHSFGHFLTKMHALARFWPGKAVLARTWFWLKLSLFHRVTHKAQALNDPRYTMGFLKHARASPGYKKHSSECML